MSSTASSEPALVSGARRLFRNAVSMLASDTANRATTFLLYVLVGRYLGAHSFGQLSLALAFFYAFQVLSVAGLKILIVREVSKDRELTSRYLVNGIVIVLLSSVASLAALFVMLSVIGYAPDTMGIIVLMALGLFPYALTMIAEGMFQAWERMHYIAIANVPVNIAKVLVAIWLMTSGYSLVAVITLILLCYVAVLVIMGVLLLRMTGLPKLSIDPKFGVRMVRAGSTFMGIEGIIAVTASGNIVLLSIIATETEVGVFNAGGQLLVPLMLIVHSTVLSAFPIMCRRFESGVEGLRTIAERLIEVLTAIALPTVVGIFFLAEVGIDLIYGGGSLEGSAHALQIMIWSLVLTVMTSVLGQVLYAGSRERTTLRIVAIDAVAGIGLAVVLISWLGVTGAALAVLLTRVVDFSLHYVPASRVLNGMNLPQAVWKPVLATSFMALFLTFAGDQPLALTILGGALVYGAVLAVITMWTVGGVTQLRARYLYLWSE